MKTAFKLAINELKYETWKVKMQYNYQYCIHPFVVFSSLPKFFNERVDCKGKRRNKPSFDGQMRKPSNESVDAPKTFIFNSNIYI